MKRFRSFIASSFTKKLLPFILLVFLYIFLMPLYYQRVGSFNFVDEFNSFVGGYFLLNGKMLYKDLFFNHQMLMAYISYVIQYIFHPTTIYALVLYHRLFIFLFGFFMSLLLVFRFGWRGVIFSLFYEITKYYLFGNLFLAEAIIIYPLVYSFGVFLEYLLTQKIPSKDVYLIVFFSWFTIFTREPFVPLALFFAFFSFAITKEKKVRYGSIFLFLALSCILLFTTPLPEYIHQVFYLNSRTVGSTEIQMNGLNGVGIVKILFYPLSILLFGEATFFREILISFSAAFFVVLFSILLSSHRRKKSLLIFTYTVFLLAGVRYVVPGTEFYAGYRLLPWYGLFVFWIIDMTHYLYKDVHTRKQAIVGTIILLGTFLLIASSGSFLWNKTDRQKEFINNYSLYISTGNMVRKLADAKSTLFVDGWESLIFWQAGVKPAYKSIVFYPIVAHEKEFMDSKAEMLSKYPPDFYYTSCGNDGNLVKSSGLSGRYAQIWQDGRPTCLMINKHALNEEKKSIIKRNGLQLQ